MDELVIAAVSALVGSAATLLWEGALKPRRERQTLAAALAAELAANAFRIRKYELLFYPPDPEPRQVPVADAVYQAAATRLGTLRFHDTITLTALYHHLRSLRYPVAFVPDERLPELKSEAERELEEHYSLATHYTRKGLLVIAKQCELAAIGLLLDYPRGWPAVLPRRLRRLSMVPELTELGDEYLRLTALAEDAGLTTSPELASAREPLLRDRVRPRA